jgi:hypothetical protein
MNPDEYAQLLFIVENAQSMGEEQAKLFELKLVTDPNDLNTRVELIGFYNSQAFRNASFDEKRVEHLLWFIAHHSDHPIVDWTRVPQRLMPEYYLKVKSAWVEELEKPGINDESIKNAVHFIVPNEPNLALAILLRFKQLDDSGKWDDFIRFVESLTKI